MNPAPRTENAALPLPLARQVEAAYQRFESAWRAGQRPLIEDHLGSLPGAARAVLLPELLEVELSCRRRADSSAQEAALDQVEGPEPTPAFAAQVAEECRRLLERLDSPELRAVALRKVEGYGNEEIAAQLGCGLRTVERRLRLIRGIWEQEGAG